MIEFSEPPNVNTNDCDDKNDNDSEPMQMYGAKSNATLSKAKKRLFEEIEDSLGK